MALSPWAGHTAFLNLSFPGCKMGLFQGCSKGPTLYIEFLAPRGPGTEYVEAKNDTQP